MDNDNLHNLWCIWTCEGEKQEVYGAEDLGHGSLGEPYTESVNTDTQGWLSVAVLFYTENEALAFNNYHDLDGYVCNVGDFLREHGAL